MNTEEVVWWDYRCTYWGSGGYASISWASTALSAEQFPILAAENLPEQRCLLRLEEQGRPYPAGSSAGGFSRPHRLSSFCEISDHAGWSGLLEEEKEGNVPTSLPISGEHTGGMAGEGPHLVNRSRHTPYVTTRWAWRSGSGETIQGSFIEEQNGLSCPLNSVSYTSLDGCSWRPQFFMCPVRGAVVQISTFLHCTLWPAWLCVTLEKLSNVEEISEPIRCESQSLLGNLPGQHRPAGQGRTRPSLPAEPSSLAGRTEKHIKAPSRH